MNEIGIHVVLIIFAYWCICAIIILIFELNKKVESFCTLIVILTVVLGAVLILLGIIDVRDLSDWLFPVVY